MRVSDASAGDAVAVVTGGAGFIGSHLVDALRARGWRVVVFDDLSGGRRENVPSDVPIDVLDVSSESVAERLRYWHPRVLVHCAAHASVPGSMARPIEDYRANQFGTLQIARAAGQVGVRQIVFLSSGGAVYGNVGYPASEDQVPAPANYYGVHKWAGERYVELSGVPSTILRLANIFGPRQRADAEGGAIAIFFDRIARGLPAILYGTGEQTRDYVYVSDVVDAILAAIDHQLSGVYNVGSGQPRSMRSFVERVGATLGVTPNIHFEPSRPGDVDHSSLDPSRLIGTGHWRPRVSIDDGLRCCAEALR